MTLEVHAKLHGFKKADFDRKPIRKALVDEGKVLQKQARRLVARKGVSDAGSNPGRLTGILYRSIRYKTAKDGFAVFVSPYNTPEMKANTPQELFYPAVLMHGSRKMNIDPRNNYMEDVFNARKDNATNAIRDALEKSIKFK